MQWIAHALPPSYVFEGMRSLLAGNGFPGGLLLRGAAVAALERSGELSRAANGWLLHGPPPGELPGTTP